MKKLIIDKIKSKGKVRSELSAPQADDFPPRIEPGYYDAICYKTKIGLAFGGRRNLYFRFRIIDGKYDGLELFMTCTYPDGKLSPNFKYYKQWMLAAERRPHKKEHHLSRKIFKDRIFRVLVRDTKPKYENGKPQPDFMKYSVIDSIIKPLTGGYPK